MGNLVNCEEHLLDVNTSHLILCYGDSNTARIGAGGKRIVSYGRTLEKKLQQRGFDVRVEVNGNSGMTAKDLYERRRDKFIVDSANTLHPGLECRLDSMPDTPALVIIMLGTNDIGVHANELNAFEYVKKLHYVCHERGIKTIALAATTVPTEVCPTNVKRSRDELAKIIEEFDMDTGNVIGHMDPGQVLDRHKANGFWERDQLHWSERGHDYFGEQLADVVENALNIIEAPPWLQGLI
jgi:lysophospholipase L1-like esterase